MWPQERLKLPTQLTSNLSWAAGAWQVGSAVREAHRGSLTVLKEAGKLCIKRNIVIQKA